MIPCLHSIAEDGAMEGTAEAWFERELSECRFRTSI